MNLTIRQKLLKLVYPLLMRFAGFGSKSLKNKGNVKPPESFYSLRVQLSNGGWLEFESLKGKKVIIVNTASDCGYTGQLKELQALHQLAGDSLFLLAFPSNDFKGQEPLEDGAIATYCQVHYGVSFPLTKKSSVIKGALQHPVYQWLSDNTKNGWNDQAPEWNFCKYVIDERGVLTHYFDSSVSPLQPLFKDAVFNQ